MAVPSIFTWSKPKSQSRGSPDCNFVVYLHCPSKLSIFQSNKQVPMPVQEIGSINVKGDQCYNNVTTDGT